MIKGKWIELIFEFTVKVIIGFVGACLYFAGMLYILNYLLNGKVN